MKKLNHTKIVCTLGPASSTPEMIGKLIDAGMNVARLNFSHGEFETHAKNVASIRKLAEERGKPVAILQDLQGPKIRTGKLRGEGVKLVNGTRVTLVFGAEQVDENIPIDYRDLAADTNIGARILLDDGLLQMKVVDIDHGNVICEVTHGGLLKSRKGVNFPDNSLSIPSITEKDTKDLLFGISQGVDYMALSFVRTAEDVQKLKQMLRALGAEISVVSKIEMLSAIKNIDAICQESDAIMVARGDLGVECGFANVASYQKLIVSAARKYGKPVIVATQMLDSMIENKRPTKAEICDVANAVFDLADATMLSGESASGKYPELTVQTMRDILDRVDHSGKLVNREIDPYIPPGSSVPFVVAKTAAELANRCKAAAIVCLTLTGNIVKTVAKNRPESPIIALSPRPDVIRKLALVRGVIGVQNPLFYSADKAISEIAKLIARQGLVEPGDLLVITGGIPLTAMKHTNLIKLHRVVEEDFV